MTKDSKSWDATWEKIYRSQEWGKYPPEDLVRFIARNYYAAPHRSAVRILDLGCGTGAATWYMAREGFSVSGVDGSPTAIAIAKKRFAKDKLRGDLRVGDIVTLSFVDATFDAVTDIASIQHNKPANIKKIIDEVYRVLKPGGLFFGMMIAEHKELANWPGVVHFSGLGELRRMFRAFDSVTVDYYLRTQRNGRTKIKFWLVEAKK